MALPTVSVLNAAIDTIYSVFSNRKTRPGNRYAVGLLQKMRTIFLNAYRGDVDFTVTDGQDDSLEGFFGAAIADTAEDYEYTPTNDQDANLYVMFRKLEDMAVDADDLTLTDNTEFLAAALLAGGEIGTAVGQECVAGDVFSVATANDTIE
ncbi:hypothetical protein LCGC14_3118920, partial [marine sediment metagenome]